MTDLPLISVITPTWHRHDMLLYRCMPSVQQQTYPNVEHVVVSDGPDPELAVKITKWVKEEKPVHDVKFEQLPEHSKTKHWGHLGRLRALELATGNLIAYLDDDDMYRPKHCAILAQVLADYPDAGFAYTMMVVHGVSPGSLIVIGKPTLQPQEIGSPMIMHHRRILNVATWSAPHGMEDWRLVEKWLKKRIKPMFVPEMTVEVWPSVQHDEM
jgi:glycosyltransferase involved in cell wall biosynthesis